MQVCSDCEIVVPQWAAYHRECIDPDPPDPSDIQVGMFAHMRYIEVCVSGIFASKAIEDTPEGHNGSYDAINGKMMVF